MGYYSYRKRKPPHYPGPIHPVPWSFLDFPEDIRNLIYHHLLVDDTFSVECLTERTLRRRHLFPEIMRTCRQIHGEAMCILYSGNYFTIQICYNATRDYELSYVDTGLHLSSLHHTPLMRNWRVLIKKSEYTGSFRPFYETIPWELRKLCMDFQMLKISVSNLLVFVEDSLPLINWPIYDLLSPLKELCVSGKISIEVISRHVAPYESSAFEYFRKMKAIMKGSTKGDGLSIVSQEDARVVQSRFFIQDLETVARIFQNNIDDEACVTELQDILQKLGRDRTKGISTSSKRIVREELCQYLGRLEDIFNFLLHGRMKSRSSYDYNAADTDLRAMSKARRWLYMRPEYRAWIQRHDRNAYNSKGPIYYQKDYWDGPPWHNKDGKYPCFASYCGRPKPMKVEPPKSSPSPSDITEPSKPTKLLRPRKPNGRYAISLDDLYSAEDMTPGLRDQASTCTLTFQVSHRQHRQAISLKTQRQKKPRKRKWVAHGGEKLGDCLGLYEECP